MGHFVRNDGFNLFVRHALEQTGGDGHQGRVFEGAGGKGVGVTFKNTHFGHADPGLLSELAHGFHNPGFVGILRLLNHAHTRAPLGHGFADQQGNNGAAKTHHQRVAQQGAQVQAVGGEVAVNAQQTGHQPEHGDDHDIGQHKQNNAFHIVLFQLGACNPQAGSVDVRGKGADFKTRRGQIAQAM